jgi:hypothetical protein
MTEDLERKVTELYLHVKRLFLLAEETSPGFTDFLQPVFELNRAFDHANRVKAVEFGLRDQDEDLPSESIEAYKKDNYRKAIGHLYRAFFDTVDWLSMNLREAIVSEFEGFSHESIQAVIPEYYSEVRPAVEKANQEIATLRAKKDVGNPGAVKLMEDYEKLVVDLRDRLKGLLAKKPGLIDYETRRARERSSDKRGRIFLAIVCAVGGALIAIAGKAVISGMMSP